MVDAKVSINVQIPGGPQINSAQSLLLEAYKYFDITLDKTQKDESVTLADIKKLNLILVKATLTKAKDSPTKLIYKVGSSGTFVEMDAPLLMSGSWVASLATDTSLQISVQLAVAKTSQAQNAGGSGFDPLPDDSTDLAKVEIITGWAEAE